MTVSVNIRRFQEVSAVLIVGITLLAMLLLAACGGNDDTGTSDAGLVPIYSGATKLDDADATTQEIAELGFKASDVTASAYKSDDAFKAVSAFYMEGVEGDGWTVDQSLSVDEQTIAVLTNGARVVYVMLAHGATVGELVASIQTDDLDIDASTISESETLMIFLQLTCDEASVDACATFGA